MDRRAQLSNVYGSAQALPPKSNPDIASLKHAVTLLVGWEQVEEFLCRPRHMLLSVRGEEEHDAERRKEADTRFRRTLHYLYSHMRCGIYVLVRFGALQIFAPFVNPNYANNWHRNINMPPPTEYYAAKSRALKKPMEKGFLMDASTWWVNAGGIVCNEPGDQLWGDHNFLEHRRLIVEVCASARIRDCEFFINKRDHPQLRRDRCEPYAFCFPDTPNLRLALDWTGAHAPILSGYTSRTRFEDVPWPVLADVYPTYPTFPLKAWSARRPVAVWRGSATGDGVDPAINQRLKLVTRTPLYPHLDAGITAWSMRDRIVGGKMRWMTPIGRSVPRLSWAQQQEYKYVVYVQGHSAADRYGALMCSGSVVLKVDSTCAADELWFFSELKPWVDHVPVQADLSDLDTQIAWLQKNDVAAENMSIAALKLHAQLFSSQHLHAFCASVLNTL